MKYAMKYEQLSVESKRTVNERGCHGHSLLTAGKSWVVNEGGEVSRGAKADGVGEGVGTYLCVVPPDVQPVVAQQRRVLVDVVDGQLDGRHDAAAHAALGYAAGHAAAEREEPGDVHVVPLVGRGPLPGRAPDRREPPPPPPPGDHCRRRHRGNRRPAPATRPPHPKRSSPASLLLSPTLSSPVSAACVCETRVFR